eukprot:11342032-Ditylum_brightwellii.AAC.1
MAEFPADKDGPGPQDNWSYSSIVGVLMYLVGDIQPDIAMGMHQCVRYPHNPCRIHEKAVKCIVHYLIKTKDTRPGKSGNHGTIINPTDDLTLDCYCDANFIGLWGHEDDQDPRLVKSRTGFVLTLGGTPILWVSKIQTE